MKYTYPVEEYINQLKAYNELESMTFSPEDSREYIISKLEERSAKKRVISDIANTMIKEYVETYEKDPDALTKEDADALVIFAESLFPDGGVSMDVGVTDYAIFYRIEKILASYYKKLGDWNQYAFAINRCSLGNMMLINGHLFNAQNSVFKKEALELAQMLDGDVLDEKSRSKVMSLLTREAITDNQEFHADMYKNIFETLHRHMGNPMSGYETSVMFFFCSIVLQMFWEHSMYAKEHGLNVDVDAARPVVGEARDFFSKTIKEHPEYDDGGEITVYLLITDFLLGDISLDEMLCGINKQQQNISENENPLQQARGLGTYNNYYLSYLYHFSTLPKEEIVRISRERINDAMPKLTSITRMINDINFNRTIVNFLNAASLTGSFDAFAEVILESTVYADKALYIHTAMVKEMSLAIFDYMIETTPETFDGVAGKDADYIRSHKDEMRQLLSECCMFHDIGKFFMLDIVENSMRRLTDDEFGLIKNHPGNFECIYQVKDDSDERGLCIRDCALTHHLWHDGTKGYPNVSQTKNRPFSDILAIADSIDAATDFLGRPYNSGKTIDELISEFQAKAGTQYGPEAASALSVPEVRDKLHYWITEGRKEIYYKIYAFNKL